MNSYKFYGKRNSIKRKMQMTVFMSFFYPFKVNSHINADVFAHVLTHTRANLPEFNLIKIDIVPITF